MKNQKYVMSALVFSGTLTLGLPMLWSQGDQGEGGTFRGKEGQVSQEREGQAPQGKESGTSQKKEGMESPMGAKKEGAEGKESQQAAAGDVKKAQQALKEKGHDPGPIDGILGPKTQAALKAFQGANNIKASGRLDGETKGKLGLSGGGGEGKMNKPPESQEKREGQKGVRD